LGLNQNNKERDSLLVKKAIKGSQKAYSELMSLYWSRIEKFFSLKLAGKEDVEDLAIATFSKAFDKLESYNDSFAFSTWIQTIANNTLIDFYRKKEQKTVSIDEEKDDEESPGLDIIDGGLDPEDNLIQKQKNKHIASLVHRLKPHYRELIIMRYLDELSYDEIANKLEMPLGSVKAKLFRARDLLLDILKPNENEY
tara:strand:+ start:323 stop:913 length:591 start_codon:yes stop_codon:yes gene_type:complete